VLLLLVTTTPINKRGN